MQVEGILSEMPLSYFLFNSDYARDFFRWILVLYTRMSD